MNAINDPLGDMLPWDEYYYTVNCLGCCVTLDGEAKADHGARSGYGIRQETEVDHLGTKAHRKRMPQARHLHPAVRHRARQPGDVFTQPRRVADPRYHCRVCSLDKHGAPRDDHWRIAAANAVEHVTGADHLRRADRLNDPRYVLWQARGAPWVLPPRP